MKKNERKQIKNMSREELQRRVAESRDKLWSIKADVELGKHKNVHETKVLRKDIARMLTQINSSNPEEASEVKK